jgi:enoyl-CoA hydratase/carnithine racemase
VVPLDRLKELAFSGRVISGSDALAHGLVTAIHDDPLASATALATEICARNPEAIRAIKQLFDKSWNPDVFGSLRREAMLQMSLLGTPNQAEAVLANLQKRTPVFGDAES